jgi:hypothetical protein
MAITGAEERPAVAAAGRWRARVVGGERRAERETRRRGVGEASGRSRRLGFQVLREVDPAGHICPPPNG